MSVRLLQVAMLKTCSNMTLAVERGVNFVILVDRSRSTCSFLTHLLMCCNSVMALISYTTQALSMFQKYLNHHTYNVY